MNYYLGNYETAGTILKEALSLSKENKNNTQIANVLNCLGLVDHALGNFAEAMKNYNESIKINKELNDQIMLAINYSNIGKLYLSFGDYKTSQEFSG